MLLYITITTTGIEKLLFNAQYEFYFAFDLFKSIIKIKINNCCFINYNQKKLIFILYFSCCSSVAYTYIYVF